MAKHTGASRGAQENCATVVPLCCINPLRLRYSSKERVELWLRQKPNNEAMFMSALFKAPKGGRLSGQPGAPYLTAAPH